MNKEIGTADIKLGQKRGPAMAGTAATTLCKPCGYCLDDAFCSVCNRAT